MYTTHGHHIPGTIQDEPRFRQAAARARCGGPGVCPVCSKEAAAVSSLKEPVVIEPTTYVRKPFEVDVVRVTDENVEAVAEWCEGTLMSEGPEDKLVWFIKVQVARALNERQTKAYPGDWVLKAGTGFKVYTDKAFHKTFEKQTTGPGQGNPNNPQELRTVGKPA